MRTETIQQALPAPTLTDQRPPEVIEAEQIAKLEEITIPTDLLRAARLCTEKPKPYGGKPYLQGVYIHRTDDGFVRVIGSDGGRLLVANVARDYVDRTSAAWLAKGVIIPAAELEARLSLLTKAGGTCVISYAEGAPHVELSSIGGDVAFKLRPVDATFPDYAKIMAGWRGSFDDGERADFRPTAFDVKHLRSVSDVASRLGVETIDAYAAPFKPMGKTGTSQEPAVFTFGRGVALFVVSRPTSGVVSSADRILLAPAIKASVAALRAHETRHRKAAKKLTGKAKDAETTKAEDFKARIEALMKRAGDGTVPAALPAPVPPPPPALPDAIEPDAAPGSEGPTAAEIAAVEAPAAAPKAVVRQGARKGGKRRKGKR